VSIDGKREERTMRCAVIAVVLAAAACGSAPSPDERLRVISTAPVSGDALSSEDLSVDGPVAALGVSAEGNLVAVAADRVLELTAGVLEQRHLYAEGTDPTTLGTVTAVTPRAAGGAWLATSNGLFTVDSRYVTHSPVVAGMGALAGAGEAPTGTLKGLWLAASNGVYRRQSAQTDRYHVDGYSEEARAVAIDGEGIAALAVLGSQLLLLTPGEGGVAAALPPEEVGTVSAVAAGKRVLFAATERGLYRWAQATTPQWTRFTLGEQAAREVRVDPVTGSAWAATDSSLIRIDGDTATAFSRPPGTRALAVDRLGDVWAATASSLVRLKAGAGSTAATFATDLKPWIQANCAMCHSDFVDPVVFTPKAETALQRVQIGDMPRCTGGVPCPTEQRLEPAQYAVLEGWIRGGKQP
jgi:ligand-binding sensor domain-containing protein